MDVKAFISQHKLDPGSLDGPGCLALLMEQMTRGLAGEGNIPMIPSYLRLDTRPAAGKTCCVLDAGGTNLRVARADFGTDGSCTLSGLKKTAMPVTQGALTAQAFYEELARSVRHSGCPERVGFCFSYNVAHQRILDGILLGWCKEVRVPDAPGKYVGASLGRAVGPECGSVHVLNDSVAALLGAHSQDSRITLGLILGTGINICYGEPCRNIPKVEQDLETDSMIISTEIGEFDGFPKSAFDAAVIAASDEPDMAHGEKQCAGGYLGELIGLAWNAAVEAEIIPDVFANNMDLPRISAYLAGERTGLPECGEAKLIARIMICRAAKIAAVLTAGPILRSCNPGQSCTLVIEGSQYEKLTGFGEAFRQELTRLLEPYRIDYEIAKVENSCLIGAAVAAFAEPM